MEKKIKKSSIKDLLKNEEIFGDLQINDFLDKNMIAIAEQRESIFEDALYKQVLKIGVYVDKDRLLKWLKKCAILDSIEESDLINFATQKRIKDLICENSNLESELERYKQKWETLVELIEEGV